MSSNAFQSVVDIDLMGTFNACRASHEHFVESRSNIVAISATHSEEAIPFQSHACAAKAGIDSLVRTLSVEWSDDDIHVNAVQPGPIDETEGMERLTPNEEARDRLKESLPVGRLGTKEDVARLVLYLVSPAASFITGAVVPVDGGLKQVGSTSMFKSIF
jgi:NAD(P)-dependent dehydrogenase (short-subunit alcohol dehydrogenase family)